MRELVDPTKQAFEKRKYAVRKVDGDVLVLCVNFENTLQLQDIKVRTSTPIDAATSTYPYRFKIDNKSIDPDERAKKGLPPFDFSKEQNVINALGVTYSFDMSLWPLRRDNKPISEILNYDMALIFQTKGCNLHDWTESGGCVYCYVDDDSNNATKADTGVWLGAKNILDTAEYLRKDSSERKGRELHRIRHSGGETTTELDFNLQMLKEIEKRGINEMYSQFDTNLSGGKFIKKMTKEKKYDKDLLTQLASYGSFVYAAFKGTTDENIQENTQAKMTVKDQIYSFGQLVDAGLEVYPCIYNPDRRHLPEFADRLDENFANASRLLRVEKINWTYGPTKKRIACMAKEQGKSPEELLKEFEEKEKANYDMSEDYMHLRLSSKYSTSYKQFDRTQYKIVRKKNNA